jgi:hypothetical protein
MVRNHKLAESDFWCRLGDVCQFLALQARPRR